MTADCYGTQRIINTEVSRNVNFNFEVHFSWQFISDAKTSRLCKEINIRRFKVIIPIYTKSFQVTCMSLKNPVNIVSIHIYNTMFALFQKHALAMKIIVKIFMLIWTDMIRLNICENTIIKCKSWNSVKH